MESHLTIEEISSILPESERINFDVPRVHYIVYTTQSGKYLPVATAKVSKNAFSFNICTDFYISIGCEFVCLVIDRYGALLMPVEVLKRYHQFSGWKLMTKKGKQYWIRGTIRDGIITLTNSLNHSENIAANKYFYPFPE